MTDPKWARATDNGRYYADPADPDALYMSVTNALDTVAKPALAPAAAKVTAEYFAEHLPRAVKASRSPAELDEFIKAAKREHKTIWEYKRDFGSLVHRHAEAHGLGQPMPYDEDIEPFIGQYLDWAERFDVDFDRDVEFVESTVLHRKHRYGGTADLGVHLRLSPDLKWSPRRRWLWGLDFKTSLTHPATAVYREQPLQLAALRYAEVLLAPDDSEFPVPKFAGTALLNLRAKTHAFIPITTDRTMHAAFVHLLNFAYYLHAQDLKPAKPLDVEAVRGIQKGAA